MTPLYYIIFFSIPALIVGFIIFALVRQFIENEQKRTLLEMRKQQQNEMLKIVTPIRLQAYERLTLFLERIDPNNLILRCYEPGMNLKLLQGVMVKNIRDEYEHNLSQQMYVSEKIWNLVKNAKEEMINMINSSVEQLPANASHTDLAGLIFKTTALTKSSSDIALESLKEEIQEMFM